MKTIFAIIGFVVVALVVGTCVACVNDDDDDNATRSMEMIQLASHGYDDGGGYDDGDCDWSGDCGDGYHQRYDQNYGSRDDRNRNRNRDRGAFSPGPFRDSPVTICLPYSCNSGGEQSGGNRNDRRDEPPPDEGRPA